MSPSSALGDRRVKARVVARREQMDGAAHRGRAHHLALLDGALQLRRLEALEPRPQADVGRTRLLRLHAPRAGRPPRRRRRSWRSSSSCRASVARPSSRALRTLLRHAAIMPAQAPRRPPVHACRARIDTWPGLIDPARRATLTSTGARRPAADRGVRWRRLLDGARQHAAGRLRARPCPRARRRRASDASASCPPRAATQTTTSCASTAPSRPSSASRRTCRCSGASAPSATFASTC